ncbi:MAG: permease [Candidatus Omnitrophica bacterium]|nr:permease [Candidatus Omnitrophota bacterium]
MLQGHQEGTEMMDKRTLSAISILVLIFAVIIVYEWGGAWSGVKLTMEQNKVITAKLLEENKIPVHSFMIFTIIDYIKHSWLCLLLAFVAAGALQEFAPRDKVIKLMGSGRGFTPYAVAGVGGPLLSMCSCSIIPLFGGLYKRGAGLGPAITFLLAAPAFNPAAILLTLGLLGWKFAAGRIIVAITAGILAGYLTDKVFKNKLPDPEPLRIDTEPNGTAQEKQAFSERLCNMMLYSWEFVKMVLPLILLGVIGAGLVKAFLPPAMIVKYLGNGILPIMLSSVVGVFMYTPTLVEVPLIRGLLESGMGTGAALAFLLTGPALSLPSILGVCKIVKPRVPLVYATLMWIFGTLAGLVFWFFVPKF